MWKFKGFFLIVKSIDLWPTTISKRSTSHICFYLQFENVLTKTVNTAKACDYPLVCVSKSRWWSKIKPARSESLLFNAMPPITIPSGSKASKCKTFSLHYVEFTSWGSITWKKFFCAGMKNMGRGKGKNSWHWENPLKLFLHENLIQRS